MDSGASTDSSLLAGGQRWCLCQGLALLGPGSSEDDVSLVLPWQALKETSTGFCNELSAAAFAIQKAVAQHPFCY